MLRPIQKFIRRETFSGVVLIIATIIALLWANSTFGDSYREIWQFEFGISTDYFVLVKPFILWINDGLMAIFFFLIGLEIKRELLVGELDSVKKAAFPFFAAVGGMGVPVLFYYLFNDDPTIVHGWAIPMATDIAFSLAILQLLGKRVPITLKIFLTAFAIVDDLGAVLVIGIYYSESIEWMLLLYAIGLLVILYLIQHRYRYSRFFIFTFGVIIWVLFLKAGLHPTLAGVLVALTVPVSQKIDTISYVNKLSGIIDKIKKKSLSNKPVLSKDQIRYIDDLEDWTRKVQSPLQLMEHHLHNWVAYIIIPLFALANAGVEIGATSTHNWGLIMLIIICLVGGKFIGITLFSWIGVKTRMADLPIGMGLKELIGISFIAGVGFTMSIFIANLAFGDSPVLLDSAKMGILIGSLLSGLIGYMILRISSTSTRAQEVPAD